MIKGRMRINVADKGVKVDEASLKILDRNLVKISKLLPHLNPDLTSLNFFIKRNTSKTKTMQANYEGWMRLILPKKALYTHFKGVTVGECIRGGMKHLSREIKKYKDLHFKSQSEYPNQDTIRRKNDKLVIN